MKRSAILFVVLLICSVTYSSPAQSGRRVVSAPTPAPQQPAEDSPGEYSESKPSTTTRIYPPGWSAERERQRSRKSKKDSKAAAKSQPQTASSPASNSTTTADGGGDDEGGVIKVETNLITIPVSVYERSGVYVSGLRRTDFKIFEDGKEQEISHFGTTEQPFTVALLIDTSPSTAYKIEEIQEAALRFVDQLSPQDRVMVIEFNVGVYTLTDFTNDRQQIYKAIRRTSFGGGTSLYSAVDVALRKKLSKVEGRKAIVMFTDGVDTTSSGASLGGTLADAEESDTLIYSVYYNTYLDVTGISRGGVMGMPPQVYGAPTSDEYARGRAYLEELANVTGGRVFRPESTTGGLTAAFEGIARELRSQYSIGYYPKEPGTTGQRKQLRVRVNRPNLAIRARDSYIVGTGGEPVSATKSN